MLGQPDRAFIFRAGLIAYTTFILHAQAHTGTGVLIGHVAQWGFVLPVIWTVDYHSMACVDVSVTIFFGWCLWCTSCA